MERASLREDGSHVERKVDGLKGKLMDGVKRDQVPG